MDDIISPDERINIIHFQEKMYAARLENYLQDIIWMPNYMPMNGSIKKMKVIQFMNMKIGLLSDIYKTKKCHSCGKFIGSKGQLSGGHDCNWYCQSCYKKGLDEEYQAMGLR